jgi:hypothetical protein
MMYGMAQKHAMADELFDLMGVKDASRFLMSPDSPEFQQQMQQQQQEMQMQQQMQMQQMQMQAQLMQSADQREWQRVQHADTETKLKVMDTASDNDREDEKLEHTKVVDFAKLGIERGKLNASGTT